MKPFDGNQKNTKIWDGLGGALPLFVTADIYKKLIISSFGFAHFVFLVYMLNNIYSCCQILILINYSTDV